MTKNSNEINKDKGSYVLKALKVRSGDEHNKRSIFGSSEYF